MLKKYGKEFNGQREEVKKSLRKSKLSDEHYQMLSDPNWFEENYFSTNDTLLSLMQKTGIDKGTIHSYLLSHGLRGKQGYRTSRGQLEILEFIESLGFRSVLNDRTVLNKKEIDIFVPEKYFGIEYDGLYYHGLTEFDADTNIHLRKVNDARSVGIDLIRITEEDWMFRKAAFESHIKRLLDSTQLSIVDLNDCDARSIDRETVNAFSNLNSIEAHNSSSYTGFFLNGILVFIAGVTDGITDWWCQGNNLNVKGIEKAVTTLKLNNRLYPIRYIESMGFVKQNQIEPDYFWTDTVNLYPKTHLKELGILPFSGKWRIYYDCGYNIYSQ
jgi:hypothetical protein